jgi:AMP deaminase
VTSDKAPPPPTLDGQDEHLSVRIPESGRTIFISNRPRSIFRPTDAVITAELETVFKSFQACLELRDKYMRKSRQRLGDNPTDYDGRFLGLNDELADVSGVRPDADHAKNSPPPSPFDPWKIYPNPPPPRWHWTDKKKVVSPDGIKSPDTDEEFSFSECPIPGPHPWVFEIDEKGVYQVYEGVEGELRLSPQQTDM